MTSSTDHGGDRVATEEKGHRQIPLVDRLNDFSTSPGHASALGTEVSRWQGNSLTPSPRFAQTKVPGQSPLPYSRNSLKIPERSAGTLMFVARSIIQVESDVPLRLCSPDALAYTTCS